MGIQKGLPVADTRGHYNIGPNVVFETLELYIYICIYVCIYVVRSSRRVRPVVANVVIFPPVRPTVSPVVVCSLPVRPFVVTRPLSVRSRPSSRRPSSVRPSRRPSNYWCPCVICSPIGTNDATTG